MIRNRLIPVLLLKNSGLVKTIKFRNPTYIGDPINAVRIFNEKEVDELCLLDISATLENKEPNYKKITEVAGECFMPLSYGGGIKNINQIKKLFDSGVEKVIVNTVLQNNLNLIKEASEIYGEQSIVGSIDVKKNFWGKYEVFVKSGTQKSKKPLIDLLKDIQSYGIGEILLNSIDRDGTQAGMDLKLISEVNSIIRVPLVACGGVGNLDHIKDAIVKCSISAVAAGSMFVFHGKHRAVLINYPTQKEINKTFNYDR